MKLVSELASEYKDDPREYRVCYPQKPGLAIGVLKDGRTYPFSKENKKLPMSFTPLKIRGLTFNNRIFVSPMCMYSSQDGFLTDWHIGHYGGMSMHSPGSITVEATGVTHHGRISIACAGIWKDEHMDGHRRVVNVVKSNGVRVGLQLVHSGRKGSSLPLWESRRGVADNSIGGWTDEVFGPSSDPYDEICSDTREISIEQLEEIKQAFVDAALRGIAVGYDYIELHVGHGYLLSSFLSPIVNKRNDKYGGSFTNRIRLTTEIVELVRSILPEDMPLWVRISCDECVEGGWSIDDSVKLSSVLKNMGVDLIDCSNGGINSDQKIVSGPMYQVPYAQKIKEQALIKTGAVGMITTPSQIEEILENGYSDVVFLARQFQLDPSIVSRTAVHLGVDIAYPNQYLFAKTLVNTKEKGLF
ncbi:putative NADPH dehydrogenase [Smittium mucronatum]|uniref:Putative NADPH dehydrogenase n=1 Tax=Smittium mucronatum TaxID=133383 RepID=A0A1R0GUP3_9FUNG|nr:putative NADPH dehydrogenase [Smittium mucronatum]